MNAELNELFRLLTNLIRLGTIAATDYATQRVRVQVGNNLTDWRPWVTLRAGAMIYLSRLSKKEVANRYAEVRTICLNASRASGTDEGALRMSDNYAAVYLAWLYLTEFAGINNDQGNVDADLFEEMNRHISETSADREPWVWIMEIVLSEIAANRFAYPYAWQHEPIPALLIRTSHIMDHISTSPTLREKWNGLPVKSERVFKKQMINAGLVSADQSCERTINHQRISNLQIIPIEKLRQFGLDATPSIYIQ